MNQNWRTTGMMLLFFTAITLSVQSCTTMKKDCHGKKHRKLDNGIYI